MGMTKKELTSVAVVLVVLAIVLHGIHILIFGDPHHVAIYGFGDIAFLPVEILVISLVVDRVLKEREREAIRDKMNMVVGTFFNAIGRRLLDRLPKMLENREDVVPSLALAPGLECASNQDSMQGGRDSAHEDPAGAGGP